jgi:hypothetical protein
MIRYVVIRVHYNTGERTQTFYRHVSVVPQFVEAVLGWSGVSHFIVRSTSEAEFVRRTRGG